MTAMNILSDILYQLGLSGDTLKNYSDQIVPISCRPNSVIISVLLFLTVYNIMDYIYPRTAT